MKLFLGVDGGQSGTTATIGDEGGRIVAMGTPEEVAEISESHTGMFLEPKLYGQTGSAVQSSGKKPSKSKMQIRGREGKKIKAKS